VKVCIVSSCGGHLTEVRCLAPAYRPYPHFYVLNDRIELPQDMRGKTWFIAHSERDWKFVINLFEAVRILRRERPAVVLSAGAGPAVPFAIVGRLFFGCRVIYIETVTRISSPSLTGRIMYWLAHDFYIQWRSLARYFPKARFAGSLL
jgi:UDP-N-acetylglucosamine:LPS N-acetylglucosamine transferase